VKSCLFLLHRLDNDICSQSKTWFDCNMIQLKEADVEGLVGGWKIFKAAQIVAAHVSGMDGSGSAFRL